MARYYELTTKRPELDAWPVQNSRRNRSDGFAQDTLFAFGPRMRVTAALVTWACRVNGPRRLSEHPQCVRGLSCGRDRAGRPHRGTVIDLARVQTAGSRAFDVFDGLECEGP